MLESVTGSARYSVRREAIALVERFIKATAHDKKLAELRSDAQRFIACQLDPAIRQRLAALRTAMRYDRQFATVIGEIVGENTPETLAKVIKTDAHLGPLISEYLRTRPPALPGPKRRRKPATQAAAP